MAKELMEIGGFITEGAEIVNHDNSLSGNGTVDSPLGLNETVLWEGDASPSLSVTTGTWSEPLSNFERVRMYWKNNDTGSYKCAEYPTEYGLNYLSDCATYGQWWKGIAVLVNNTGFTSMKCWEIVLGSTITASEKSTYHFLKLVGINRIANN